MKALFLLSLGLCALAAPARAADLATLGCVSEKLPLLAKAQVEIDVERNLRETGKRPSFDPKLLAALKAATEACAAANRWPAEALQPAALYTRAKLGWNVAQRVAAERGFDPAVLETVWLTLSEEQRNAPLGVDGYRMLADAAIPEGDQRTRENGEFISEFYQILSLIQYCSYDFARAGEPSEPAAPEPEAAPPTGSAAPSESAPPAEPAPEARAARGARAAAALA
ncbi:MAG: hypothetical protein WDN24_16875 [Sphingomonas sp.]